MSSSIKNIEIKSCNRLDIDFQTPEGLNLFTQFMFRNNIVGMSGFELSKRNTTYTGFFSDDEIEKIKEHYKVEKP